MCYVRGGRAGARTHARTVRVRRDKKAYGVKFTVAIMLALFAAIESVHVHHISVFQRAHPPPASSIPASTRTEKNTSTRDISR